MLEMRENEIALRTFEGTLVARTFDVIVAWFGGKSIFHVAKKFIGFYSKRCGAETNHAGNKVSA